MQDNEFEAAGVRVQASHDGESVRLGFYDESERENAIIISSDHVPTLLSQLQPKIGAGTVRPMSVHGMPLGTIFELRGIQTGPLPGGGCRLILHLKVEDGV